MALAFLVDRPRDVRAQSTAPAQTTAAPDFRVEVLGHFDGEAVAAFKQRVQEYATLRRRLEAGLPPLVVTLNADEIESFEHRLTERLRDARHSDRGQVFIPAMAEQIRKLLASRADPATIAAIMEDGPGEFDVDVNETYSKERPLATMPPNILLLLPDLPAEVEYRFVGRHLILRDVRANMIIDEIRHAITCDSCVIKPEADEH